MPLMRLDENGNPVYYLTDAMGSVIGLADGSGAEIADFRYDSFGNLRSSTGIEGDRELEAGGDFRFQGQWLESQTDLYHFRARYYDPESGRFVSRDPVELIEYEPESSNPYQFVYNNPYIYSDPTGEFTISEIGVAQKIENILNNLRTNALRNVSDWAIDEARGIATDILLSAFNQLIPFDLNGTLNTIQGYDEKGLGVPNWEDMLIENSICSILNSSSYKDHVWKDVKVSQSGEPLDNGYPCGQKAPFDLNDSKPDFIIKNGKPKTTDGKPKAYLIGDAKLKTKNIKSGQKNGKQFNAIINYADYDNKHQYVPIATYVTIFGDEDNEKKLKKRALKQGVELFIIDFFPQSKSK